MKEWRGERGREGFGAVEWDGMASCGVEDGRGTAARAPGLR